MSRDLREWAWKLWRKSIPGRKRSQCQDPEVGMTVACTGSSKNSHLTSGVKKEDGVRWGGNHEPGPLVPSRSGYALWI